MVEPGQVSCFSWCATRADRCTYVCYGGQFKENKTGEHAADAPISPEQTSYYVDVSEGVMARDESLDVADEVRRSFAVEERLFSACYQNPSQKYYDSKTYKNRTTEDCAWTPVVDENLVKLLDSVEHKPGWYPHENGFAQVAYRAKALRTPEPQNDRRKYHLRTSIVKRKGVWWLIEMNHDISAENMTVTLEQEAEVLVSLFHPSQRSFLSETPQLTPEVVEELLEHFMDPVHGSNSKGRKPIQMCCLHVDDLFITGTPEFLEKFKKPVKAQFKVGHEDLNDLMFTGQHVKWHVNEKTKKKEYIAVEQSLAVQELTETEIPKGMTDDVKCDKALHTAYRSLLGSINWLQSRTQFQVCYQFSRCASAAASPTIGDCKVLGFSRSSLDMCDSVFHTNSDIYTHSIQRSISHSFISRQEHRCMSGTPHQGCVQRLLLKSWHQHFCYLGGRSSRHSIARSGI